MSCMGHRRKPLNGLSRGGPVPTAQRTASHERGTTTTVRPRGSCRRAEPTTCHEASAERGYVLLRPEGDAAAGPETGLLLVGDTHTHTHTLTFAHQVAPAEKRIY